jgi:hypothetical protein
LPGPTNWIEGDVFGWKENVPRSGHLEIGSSDGEDDLLPLSPPCA